MNNPWTKRDDLEADELKTIPIELEKLSDVEIKKRVSKTQKSTH